MALININNTDFTNSIVGYVVEPFTHISVEKAFSLNSLLITENKNRVYLFQVSEKRILFEWRLNSLHKLTSNVVQHKNEMHFSAVFDDYILRTWTIEDKSMHHKTVHTKIPKIGYALIVMQSGSILIIFKDGSLGWADVNKTSLNPEKMIENDLFDIRCFSFIEQDDNCIVKILAYDKDDLCHVIEYKINEKSNSILHSECKLIAPDSLEIINYQGLKIDSLNFVSSAIDDNQLIVCKKTLNPQLSTLIYILDIGLQLERCENKCNIQFETILKLLPMEDCILIITTSGIYEIDLYYQVSSLLNCMLSTQDSIAWRGSKIVETEFDLELIYKMNPETFPLKVAKWCKEVEKMAPSRRCLARPGVDRVVLELFRSGVKQTNVVKSIIQTGLVTNRCTKDLIKHIKETKDFDLLTEIIRNIYLIPEDCIVDLLCLLIQKIQNNAEDKAQIQDLQTLNLILHLPFTGEQMIMALKDLSLDHTLFLLRHLFEALSLEHVEEEKCILNWLALLLDAQYSKLIIHSDSQILVNDIRLYITERIIDSKKMILNNFDANFRLRQRRLNRQQRRKYILESFVY